MGLADARAMYPKLPVVEADFEADRRALESIADWCDRYTPLVGLDPPDGLFLDVTGCAHLFGGEAALARDLLTRLSRQGFRARAAIADTAGCAWGLARHGKQAIVPRGETQAAVLPLPIAALRVDADIVAGLKTAGLTRVADLASRPRAPFAARFGKGLLLRLDQALGRVDEPIMPRLPIPAAMAEQRFPDPIAREADVLGTIEHLGRQLATVLERRGEGGRLFQVALFRADGTVHRLEIGTGAPLRDPARIRKLFEERLAVLGDACDPGFGYDMVRLSALATERTDPAQTGLGRRRSRRRVGAPDQPVRRALRLAPHLAADAAGHAYSGVCGGERAGACAAEGGCRSCRPSSRTSLSAARPLRCSIDRNGSMPSPKCPTVRSIRFSWRHVRRIRWHSARRPRAHRHGMVARRSRQQAYARLFPCREQRRAPDVALSRRSLRSRGKLVPRSAAVGTCNGSVCVSV